MKRSRAIRLVVWCGATASAFGCAQIAGLTSDYQLGGAGSGGQTVAAGAGAAGTSAASGAPAANGGAAGVSGGSATGGEAGASGGEAGASGGAPNAGAPNGGMAGASGGAPSGGAPSGGSAGVAGAGGSSAGSGPVRIGFSEFHDSASGSDNASSHLANATFSKPAGTTLGDFILVFFGADHSLSNLSGSDLSAAGWTLLDQHENYGTDGQATYLIYKFASAAEPDPIVFSGVNATPSGDGVQGLLSVYRGVNAASPVNAYEVTVVPTGDDTAVQVVTATPPITTTVANCLLIVGLSPDTTVDAPVIFSWPQGFVQNQVSVNNPAHPYPDGWANIYSAERPSVAAGTVPASGFGWTIVSGAGYYGSLTFVLALAP